ncbi:hypothetical protein [Helicobacter sp. T3_23-1056]
MTIFGIYPPPNPLVLREGERKSCKSAREVVFNFPSIPSLRADLSKSAWQSTIKNYQIMLFVMFDYRLPRFCDFLQSRKISQ